MPKPHLVIIAGPPGAGKSSLTQPLARRLGYSLLGKDAIKERLGDAFGDAARDHSRELGLAAILVLYDVARELLRNGQSAIIESTFYRGISETDLLPLIELANAVMIHITADDETLLSRYEARGRSGNRHPVHTDAERTGELRDTLASGATRPPDVAIPVIEIDTTYGPLDVEEIAFMISELRVNEERPPHA